jgi:DNA phosphorothioation-dependent restriction protein DptG
LRIYTHDNNPADSDAADPSDHFECVPKCPAGYYEEAKEVDNTFVSTKTCKEIPDDVDEIFLVKKIRVGTLNPLGI